ncbi:dodecenoyl-CoA isomerase [Xylographa carneopallida]|nr:dodecenoyl-CoA isomerase [Xylographa carneopallida]
MALCCDYRLLTRAGGSMGLNEAALGIPVPRYWMEVMARTVGWRRTEALLQKGELLSAAQAAQFGLVDELVDDAAALLPAAEREVAERLRIPAAGRTASKRLMRDELAQQWEAQWRSEADESWKLLSSDETVRALGRVLQRLSGNKEAGARQQRQAKL